MSILKDFQEVSLFLISQGRKTPVINHNDIGLCNGVHDFVIATISPG
jgi:hypothetical protein